MGVVLSAANRTDMKLAEAVLDSIVVDRPAPTTARPQHLCRDKGFDFAETDPDKVTQLIERFDSEVVQAF